jgi:tetratricopeptide (TPR) repeat protein
MRRLRSGLAAVLLVSLLAAPAAHAGKPRRRAKPPAAPVEAAPAAPAVDPADALLDEGTHLFTEEADYDGALSRFQESYRTRPSWKALSGMALVYQQQGRYVEAIDTYERLLHDFGATLTDAQMSTVRRRLGELDQRVGVVVVKIAQPEAVVYIDGHEVSRGAGEVRVRVLPGPHTLVATLERHETLTRRIDAQPGHALPIDVRLGAERVQVVVQQQRFERPYPTWVPWLTMGGGVLLALTGGGLHYAAIQDFDAFDAKVAAEVPVGGMALPVDDAFKRSGERKQDAAISLYALAGVTAATGLVLLFFDRPRPVESRAAGSARVYFDGRSFGVAGAF